MQFTRCKPRLELRGKRFIEHLMTRILFVTKCLFYGFILFLWHSRHAMLLSSVFNPVTSRYENSTQGRCKTEIIYVRRSQSVNNEVDCSIKNAEKA